MKPEGVGGRVGDPSRGYELYARDRLHEPVLVARASSLLQLYLLLASAVTAGYRHLEVVVLDG
jgi:hypothetical protein